MRDKRSIGITIFSYLGVIFGIFNLMEKGLIKLEPTKLFFALVYVVLSYNLLKLRNWSRISFLIINTFLAAVITLSYFFLFFWLPWIGRGMTGSFFKTLYLMYPLGKSLEILKATFPYNPALVFAIFLIYNVYLYGFLIFFTRLKVKAQFTGVLIENKPILPRIMKKCLPYFTAIGLALVIYLGISQYISYVSNKRLRAEAKKDPLACAFYTAKKIKRDGIKHELLTKIAVEYANNGKFNKALEVAKTISFDVTRADALSQISSEYIKIGQIENALPLLFQALQIANKQKQDSFLKAELLSMVSVNYAEAKEYDNALQLANTITRHYFYKARALVGIASFYVKAGQKEKVAGLLTQSLEAVGKEENSVIKNEQLCDIVAKYAEFGQYDNALQITEMIGSFCLRAAALGRISAYYAKAGQNDKAVELLSEAVQLAGKINYNYCLWQIPDKYVEVEQYEQALKISKEIIKDPSSQARVLVKIAFGYVKSGQKDKANDILSQAIQLTKTMESVASKIFALTNISFEYAKLGQNNKASNILSEALQETKALKKDLEREVCLEIIAVKYAENGQYDQAIQVANTIKAIHFRTKTLSEIALKYAEFGQKVTENGENILDEIIKNLE